MNLPCRSLRSSAAVQVEAGDTDPLLHPIPLYSHRHTYVSPFVAAISFAADSSPDAMLSQCMLILQITASMYCYKKV